MTVMMMKMMTVLTDVGALHSTNDRNGRNVTNVISVTLSKKPQCHIRLSACCESKRTVGARLGQVFPILSSISSCILSKKKHDPMNDQHWHKNYDHKQIFAGIVHPCPRRGSRALSQVTGRLGTLRYAPSYHNSSFELFQLFHHLKLVRGPVLELVCLLHLSVGCINHVSAICEHEKATSWCRQGPCPLVWPWIDTQWSIVM